MEKLSLGLIETWGIVPAMEAADVGAKAANVTLLGYQVVPVGRVMVTFVGDVAAVTAAVSAGAAAAGKLGRVLAVHVIPRPDRQLLTVRPFEPPPPHEKQAQEKPEPPSPREETKPATEPESPLSPPEEEVVTAPPEPPMPPAQENPEEKASKSSARRRKKLGKQEGQGLEDEKEDLENLNG
jgi:microcompartment protein CcmL/EutN